MLVICAGTTGDKATFVLARGANDLVLLVDAPCPGWRTRAVVREEPAG